MLKCLKIALFSVFFGVSGAIADCGFTKAEEPIVVSGSEAVEIALRERTSEGGSEVYQLSLRFTVEQLDPDRPYVISLSLLCRESCPNTDMVELGQFAIFPLANEGEQRDLTILLDASEVGTGKTHASIALQGTDLGTDVGITRIRLDSVEISAVGG